VVGFVAFLGGPWVPPLRGYSSAAVGNPGLALRASAGAIQGATANVALYMVAKRSDDVGPICCGEVGARLPEVREYF